MAQTYAHLYGIPCSGVRFFTVYGPWGRPDMAYYTFTKAILEGRPIDVFNDGRMQRDFTYVDDVTEAVVRLVDRVPASDPSWSGDDPNPATSLAPWRLYNIGNNRPEDITTVVALLEREFGRKAVTELAPIQPGDVAETCANVDALMKEIGFRPATPIEEGIRRFVAWYQRYYRP
jgi:UDP-glucuronate 4-epimerase